MNNYQPVFLLGNPRSGTTLLRLMLNSHPQIVAPPECGFSHWWYPKYADWKLNDSSTKRLDDFMLDLFSSKRFETWRIDEEGLKRFIIRNNPNSYSELVGLVYLKYSEEPQKIRAVIDKNNYYINYTEDLLKIWPHSKLIHLVRDGRDVACSYLDVNKLKTASPYKPKFPNSILEIAEEWMMNNNKIESLKHLGKERYLLLKFEDLIIDSESSLTRICEFIDLSFSSNMSLYYGEHRKGHEEPMETLDWKSKTKESPDPKKIGRFNNHFSPADHKLFFSCAGKTLKKYGYA